MTLVAVRVAVKMGEIVLNTKRVMFVVIAALATMLTTLGLPAQAASVPGKPVAKLTSGSSRVILSWVAPASNRSTITAYQVGARKFASGKWQAWSYYNLSRTYRSKAVTYTNGTKVQAKVRAKNAKGFGAWSTVQSTVTGLPNAPTSRAVTQGDKFLTVSWGAAVGNGSAITAYRVYYRSQVGGVWGAWAYSTTSGSIRTESFGSLTPGTNYQFYIRTANKWGYGPSTSILSTVVLSAPDPPTNVTWTPNDFTLALTLSWSAPLNTGGSAITSYKAFAVRDGTKTCTTSTLTCTITGLTNGTSYTFTVTATNIAGTSGTASPSSALITATAPGAPTEVKGVGGYTEVTVSWAAPINTGGRPITSYTATALPGGATCTTTVEPPATTPATSCTITGLTNGTVYRFKVTATNIAATSTPSSPSSGVITATAPNAPTGVNAVLGNTQVTLSWSPPVNTDVFISSATQISAGGSHTCALLQDHTIKCWGGGRYGELGNGQYYTNPPPLGSATPVIVSGISNATQISSGRDHTCALLQDNTIKCWGDGRKGQLGNGQFYNSAPYGSATPVTVSGISNATQISASSGHTCALLQDNTIKCWGFGREGQLGDAVFYSNNYSCGVNYWNCGSATPVTVRGISNATQISAGDRHTCALLQDNTIKCWGNRFWGQLGDGQYDPSLDSSFYTPVIVSGISNATQISAGSTHTCALLQDNTIKCWGSSLSGELGNGQFYRSATPVIVSGISNATQISAGLSNTVPNNNDPGHTCALLQDNTIKCWGGGRYGELGNVQASGSATPVIVSGISNATQISAGNIHTCALLQDNTIKCWGDGRYGQLGNGLDTFNDGGYLVGSSFTPVTVIQIPDDGGSPITSYTATAVEDPTKSCTVLAPATSCTIAGLAPGNYTFTVTATNAVGTSLPSAASGPVTIP